MEFQVGSIGGWIVVGVGLVVLAYAYYKKKTSSTQA